MGNLVSEMAQRVNVLMTSDPSMGHTLWMRTGSHRLSSEHNAQ